VASTNSAWVASDKMIGDIGEVDQYYGDKYCVINSSNSDWFNESDLEAVDEPTEPKATQIKLEDIKVGDTVWAEGVVKVIYPNGFFVEFGKAPLQFNQIKKHFPKTPTELEVAEAEFKQAELEAKYVLSNECFVDDAEDRLDRYYIARSRVEKLKNK